MKEAVWSAPHKRRNTALPIALPVTVFSVANRSTVPWRTQAKLWRAGMPGATL